MPDTRVGMTVREALAWGARELEADSELRATASLDAALLLRHVVGISQAAMLAWPDRVLTAAEDSGYRAVLARRLAFEPVQYITGEQEFYGLALHVSPAVLIPRPETELLVETVVAELRGPCSRLRILDVGTGSGAIAIALAQELPGAELVGVDVSPEALQVARENAARHGVGGRIRFVESDLMSDPAAGGRFDAVVSNPPYVPERDRAAMHPQVRDYEPAGALFAGESGLEIYRRLVPAARERLSAGGLLAMEIGFGQQNDLAELLRTWNSVRFVDDLQGIPRVVSARRPT